MRLIYKAAKKKLWLLILLTAISNHALSNATGMVLNETYSNHGYQFYLDLSQKLFIADGDIYGDIILREETISGSSSYISVYLKNQLVYKTKLHTRSIKYIPEMSKIAKRNIEKKNLNNVMAKLRANTNKQNLIKEANNENNVNDTESGAGDSIKRICDRADIPAC